MNLFLISAKQKRTTEKPLSWELVVAGELSIVPIKWDSFLRFSFDSQSSVVFCEINSYCTIKMVFKLATICVKIAGDSASF